MGSKTILKRLKFISRQIGAYAVDTSKPLFVTAIASLFFYSTAHAQPSCPIVFGESKARETRQTFDSETRIASHKLLMTLNQGIKNSSRSQVTLDNKIEITGKLQEYTLDSNNQIAYLSFSGPTRLSDVLSNGRSRKISGQDETHHAPGFGTAVGEFKMKSEGKQTVLEFDTGVVVRGTLTGSYGHPTSKEVSILSFTDCTVTRGDRVLFEPSWGTYDMAVGAQITSIQLN